MDSVLLLDRNEKFLGVFDNLNMLFDKIVYVEEYNNHTLTNEEYKELISNIQHLNIDEVNRICPNIIVKEYKINSFIQII